MSIERVRTYFKEKEIPNEILEFSVSSATVELAAAALGCEPARIAKSLAFWAGEQVVLVVAAGDAKVDNQKFKAKFGAKPKMLAFDEVEWKIGHAVGGVCPFGIREGVPVYLDISLKRFETVYPACGSSNSAVKMTMDELEKASSGFAGWVDVCKAWS